MAIRSWPYISILTDPEDPLSGDRKISAADEADGYDIFVKTGVVPDFLGVLEVSKVPDSMNVSINTGAAIVTGHRIISDEAEIRGVDPGDAEYSRIDIIAIESNENTGKRAGDFVVVKGEASASPVPPTLTQNSAVWQNELAQLLIPAGAANLNTATLTDKRTFAEGRHRHVIDAGQIGDGVLASKHCRAYKISQQSIPRMTSVAVSFDTEAYDTDGMHNNTTNNSQITINTTGVYVVVGEIKWGASKDNRELRIFRNGNDELASNLTSGERMQVVFIGELSSGDYIETKVFHTNTSDSVEFGSHFSAVRIGAIS